jgi:hypothetical protein
VSLEQRILNVAEKQNYYDSRELRAIALEVRKREDRIKQLEEMYEGVIGERPEFLGSNVMGLLKRELTGTQKRIKELEDRIHRAASAFFRDGSDGQVASQMLAILEEERGKK